MLSKTFSSWHSNEKNAFVDNKKWPTNRKMPQRYLYLRKDWIGVAKWYLNENSACFSVLFHHSAAFSTSEICLNVLLCDMFIRLANCCFVMGLQIMWPQAQNQYCQTGKENCIYVLYFGQPILSMFIVIASIWNVGDTFTLQVFIAALSVYFCCCCVFFVVFILTRIIQRTENKVFNKCWNAFRAIFWSRKAFGVNCHLHILTVD